MKKIIVLGWILLLLMYISYLSGFAETIKINTSYGEKTLIIPDKYEDLRTAYITMTKLYVEEKYAHEQTIKNFNNLLKVTEQIKTDTIELQKINKELLNTSQTLLKDKYLQFYILSGIDFDYLNLQWSIFGGINGIIYEQYTIQILFRTTNNIDLLFGWRIF